MNVKTKTTLPTTLLYKHSLIIFFLLFTCLITFNAQAKETMVWQSRYDYVAIAPVDDSNNNDHPAELSPQNIYDALASIRLTEAKQGFFDIDIFSAFSSDDEDEDTESNQGDNLELPIDALFTKKELRKISKPIAKALSRAKSNEDIIFSVSGRHEGFIGKSQLTTTARLFYKNKQINLVFGEVYADIQKKYRRSGGTSDVPDRASDKDLKNFRLKTGSRTKKSKLPVAFITDNSHFVGAYNGKRRKDWLKIDLPVLLSELNKNKKIEQRNENIVEETNQLQQQTVEIDKEQEKLKQKVERLERMIQEKEQAPKQPVAKTMPTKTTKSLEERLTELKQLHEKGMVSDELYNEKVRKLLEEL